jgi:nucleoside-diphosphate-sugar epimerase
LLAQGAQVRALLRSESAPSTRDPRVQYWTADLLDDRSVRESAIWKGATHVFHVGGVTKRRTLAQFRYGNVVPTANLLAAAVAQKHPVRRFVLVSSQAAAGPAWDREHPVNEGDPPHPIEAYGQSKREAEDAARRYGDTVPVTILRPGAVYGPRDVDFLSVFRQASGRVAVYAAPRTQAMSMVYVRDLVRAIAMAADSAAARGQTYFVAGAHAVTWSELYRTIATVSARSPLEIQLPGAVLGLAGRAGSLLSLLSGRHLLINANKVALARPRWWLCDSSRIRDQMGWREETSLLAGVRETYLWYQRAGWLRPTARTVAFSPENEERF